MNAPVRAAAAEDHAARSYDGSSKHHRAGDVGHCGKHLTHAADRAAPDDTPCRQVHCHQLAPRWGDTWRLGWGDECLARHRKRRAMLRCNITPEITARASGEFVRRD